MKTKLCFLLIAMMKVASYGQPIDTCILTSLDLGYKESKKFYEVQTLNADIISGNETLPGAFCLRQL